MDLRNCIFLIFIEDLFIKGDFLLISKLKRRFIMDSQLNSLLKGYVENNEANNGMRFLF